jgi:hypothetical protein
MLLRPSHCTVVFSGEHGDDSNPARGVLYEISRQNFTAASDCSGLTDYELQVLQVILMSEHRLALWVRENYTEGEIEEVLQLTSSQCGTDPIIEAQPRLGDGSEAAAYRQRVLEIVLRPRVDLRLIVT